MSCIYTLGGQKLRFFMKWESAICDRGHYTRRSFLVWSLSDLMTDCYACLPTESYE